LSSDSASSGPQPPKTADGLPLRPSVSHLTLRAILFLAWLVLANDWLVRHVGVGWDQTSVALAAASLGTGFGLLEAATGEKLKEKWLGRIVVRALSRAEQN